MKASALEPLGAHPQSAAIPNKSFEPVVRFVGEEEEMAAQRILAESIADQAEESVEAFAHVDRLDTDVDLCRDTETEHDLCRFHDANQSGERRIIEAPVAFDPAAAFGDHDREIGAALRRACLVIGGHRSSWCA